MFRIFLRSDLLSLDISEYTYLIGSERVRSMQTRLYVTEATVVSCSGVQVLPKRKPKKRGGREVSPGVPVVSPECLREKRRGPGTFGLQLKERGFSESFHFATCRAKKRRWQVAGGFILSLEPIWLTTLLQILKVIVVMDSRHR